MSIVHVARWFFAFPIKAPVFSFLLGQIVHGEPSFVRLQLRSRQAEEAHQAELRSLEATWRLLM